MDNWGLIGLVGIAAAFALPAIGSAFGTGIAAMTAIGAWKKCFLQNKPAPFLLTAFVGFPLSQTFYGLLLMNAIIADAKSLKPWVILGVGVLGGSAIALSAYLQGKAAANASDAFAETGKGVANYILALGIIESVALLGMVFLMQAVSALKGLYI